ncbi:hypothetical protein QBC39DRAFT_404760 [Podospora conica]|nr:hypothetical protein QBC39DRAFT_404760 [Schizothecium conicum]
MELLEGRAAYHQSARGSVRGEVRGNSSRGCGEETTMPFPVVPGSRIPALPLPYFVCVSRRPRGPIVLGRVQDVTNPPPPRADALRTTGNATARLDGGLPSVRRTRSRFAATARLLHNRVSMASPVRGGRRATKGPGRRKSAARTGELDSGWQQDEDLCCSRPRRGRSRGRMYTPRGSESASGQRPAARRATAATIPKFPCGGLSAGSCAVVTSGEEGDGCAQCSRAHRPQRLRARGRYIRHRGRPVCPLRSLK